MSSRCCCNKCETESYYFNIDRYAPSVYSLTRTRIDTYEVIRDPNRFGVILSISDPISTEENFQKGSSYNIEHYYYTEKASTEYPVVNGQQRIKEIWKKYTIQTRVILSFNHNDIYDWSEDLYYDINLRLGAFWKPPNGSATGYVNPPQVKISGALSDINLPNSFSQWDELTSSASFNETILYSSILGFDAVSFSVSDHHPKQNSTVSYLFSPSIDQEDFFDHFLDGKYLETRTNFFEFFNLGSWQLLINSEVSNTVWLEIIRPPIKENNVLESAKEEFKQQTVQEWIEGWRNNITYNWHDDWDRVDTMFDFVSKKSFKDFTFDFLTSIDEDFYVNDDEDANQGDFFQNGGQFGIEIFKPKTDNTKKGIKKTYFDAVFFKEFSPSQYLFRGEPSISCSDACKFLGADDTCLTPGELSWIWQTPGEFQNWQTYILLKTLEIKSSEFVGLRGLSSGGINTSTVGVYNPDGFKQLIFVQQIRETVESQKSFEDIDWDFKYIENTTNKEYPIYNVSPSASVLPFNFFRKAVQDFIIRDCVIEAPGSNDAAIDPIGFNKFLFLDESITEKVFPDPISSYRRTNFFNNIEQAYIKISFKNTDKFLSVPVVFTNNQVAPECDPIVCVGSIVPAEWTIKNQYHLDFELADFYRAGYGLRYRPPSDLYLSDICSVSFISKKAENYVDFRTTVHKSFSRRVYNPETSPIWTLGGTVGRDFIVPSNTFPISSYSGQSGQQINYFCNNSDEITTFYNNQPTGNIFIPYRQFYALPASCYPWNVPNEITAIYVLGGYAPTTNASIWQPFFAKNTATKFKTEPYEIRKKKQKAAWEKGVDIEELQPAYFYTLNFHNYVRFEASHDVVTGDYLDTGFIQDQLINYNKDDLFRWSANCSFSSGYDSDLVLAPLDILNGKGYFGDFNTRQDQRKENGGDIKVTLPIEDEENPVSPPPNLSVLGAGIRFRTVSRIAAVSGNFLETDAPSGIPVSRRYYTHHEYTKDDWVPIRQELLAVYNRQLTEDEISQVQKLKGVEFDYWYGVDGSYFKITKGGALEGPFNSYSLPYDEQTQLTEGNEYKVIVNTSFIHNSNSNVVSTGDENCISDYPFPNTYYASLPEFLPDFQKVLHGSNQGRLSQYFNASLDALIGIETVQSADLIGPLGGLPDSVQMGERNSYSRVEQGRLGCQPLSGGGPVYFREYYNGSSSKPPTNYQSGSFNITNNGYDCNSVRSDCEQFILGIPNLGDDPLLGEYRSYNVDISIGPVSSPPGCFDGNIYNFSSFGDSYCEEFTIDATSSFIYPADIRDASRAYTGADVEHESKIADYIYRLDSSNGTRIFATHVKIVKRSDIDCGKLPTLDFDINDAVYFNYEDSYKIAEKQYFTVFGGEFDRFIVPGCDGLQSIRSSRPIAGEPVKASFLPYLFYKNLGFTESCQGDHGLDDDPYWTDWTSPFEGPVFCDQELVDSIISQDDQIKSYDRLVCEDFEQRYLNGISDFSQLEGLQPEGLEYRIGLDFRNPDGSAPLPSETKIEYVRRRFVELSYYFDLAINTFFDLDDVIGYNLGFPTIIYGGEGLGNIPLGSGRPDSQWIIDNFKDCTDATSATEFYNFCRNAIGYSVFAAIDSEDCSKSQYSRVPIGSDIPCDSPVPVPGFDEWKVDTYYNDYRKCNFGHLIYSNPHERQYKHDLELKNVLTGYFFTIGPKNDL